MSDGSSNDPSSGSSAPPPAPPGPAWPNPPYGAPPGSGFGQGYGPGYGPPPGYPQQWQPGPYQAAPVTTNGMAIASMVLGILWIWWIGSILALVFGYVAKKQIDESHGTQGGRGMAIAGIALGWVGVGFLLLVMVFGVLGAVAGF